jgi:predicted transcriptional regulator
MNANTNIAVTERDGSTTTQLYTGNQSKIHNPSYPVFIADAGITEKEWAEMVADWKSDPCEPPSKEQIIQDAIEAYSQIRMFDYGTGKKSNEQAMGDFYGWGIVDQIHREIEYSYEHKLKDRKAGQISKKLWQQIKDIRAGRSPKVDRAWRRKQRQNLKQEQKVPAIEKANTAPAEPEPEKKPEIRVEQRQRQKGDDYFMTTERGIIRNETYRQIFKGPGTVYEWLWANIVRDQWRDSKAYPIREKYYEKGYLAYCSTYGRLGKELGMSKNTVHAYVEKFEAAGVIVTEQYLPEGKKQYQTVFILGEWQEVDGEIVETFYRDQVFITPKPVKK